MKSKFKRFDEKIEWNIIGSGLGIPPKSEFDQFKIENHDFEEYRSSWDEVERALEFEHSLLRRLEKAPDLEAERVLVSDELYEDDDLPIRTLDLGIGSVVLALSSMGCLTIASCNGGFLGDHHHEEHPLVVFYARAKEALFLLETAKNLNVGISNEDGPLIAWANDIWDMHASAREIFKSRGQMKRKFKF